jgi:homoserine dehydrogenase
MKIILVGFGKVGQSLAEMLELRRSELIRNYGLNLKVVAIADSRGAAISEEGIDLSRVLEVKRRCGTVSALNGSGEEGLSALEMLEVVDGDVVVEVTPTNLETGEPGLSHIEKAIKLGMHVVTTNKGPLALSLPRLIDMADRSGVLLRFSGAVGAAIPVLDFAEHCLRDDEVESIRAVLNGTTNYILWRMSENGLTMSEAIEEARRLGYAERRISYDLKGLDTATKLVIIAHQVMNRRVSLRDVQVRGINDITPDDMLDAKKDGFTIRLIGSIDGGISVSPRRIRIGEPLCVDSVFNAVEFNCSYSGRHILIGLGAGTRETANSIINDIIRISQARPNPQPALRRIPNLRRR